MEFKVGDRVRFIENSMLHEGIIIENCGRWDGYLYDNYLVKSMIGEFNILAPSLVLDNCINETKFKDLEQRIEKLEKCANLTQNTLEKCENVSNLEKMTQNTIEKIENEPIYERNERFAKILKKELEEKPNLEINLGKPNIDDKEFKEMLKNKPIVSNTNEPLEMIWNSTEEETKPSLLTEDERVILRSIPKKYNWIVRDKDWDLYLFEERPFQNEKDSNYWYSNKVCDGEYFGLFFNSMFMGIERDILYNIEELLKGGNL